jgi:hypothetical protein
MSFKIDFKNAGRVACMFGAIILAWNIAEWAFEKSYVATLSQCSEFKAYGSVLVVYSEEVRMLRCKANYLNDGIEKVANLTSKLPREFVDSTADGKQAKITITTFDKANARFAISPRDWGDTTAKVLFFVFIGLLLLGRIKKIQ